jgi:flagellar secretion chaperone FliS
MYAQQYVENDLLDKSPVDLIRLLYSKAIEKLQLALRHTRAKDVRERNACLARVMEIVAELQGALNQEAGVDLAVQLAGLYDYVQRQLVEAVADPASVAQIEEVGVLLANLYDGWKDCEPTRIQGQQPGESANPGAHVRRERTDNEGEKVAIEAVEDMPSPLAPADHNSARGDRVWTL